MRVFVVWEPVLPTDWSAPSTVSLGRLSDPRVSQFWDKGHQVSRAMGEHDRESVVWDYVAVYPPGELWSSAPPEPAYQGSPVVAAAAGARAALARLLQ